MNLNELIQTLMQYMLGGVPGGGLLNMFTPMVSQMLSPQTSMANRFVWGSDGVSPAMSAMQYMNNQQQSIFRNTASDASNALQMRALMNYHKALNPGLTADQLKVKAQADMDNPMSIPSFIMGHLDPYDTKSGIAEAESLGAILQRRNFTPMDIRGASFAAQVSDTLFGKDGKSGLVKDVIDNPRSYGNLKLSEVMFLGQEMAHTDPSGFKTDEGKFDSSKFKSSIKAVSRAIEPWKDIFGQDVPELLNKLEALTGQGIAMQKQSLSASGNRLIGVMQATGANIQHIAGYRDALAQGMSSLPFENRTVLGAHNIAADMVLGVSNNGMHSMTNEEFQATAGQFYKGTAESKLADRYALAFSAWSDNQGSPFRDMALKYKEHFKVAKDRGWDDKAASNYAIGLMSQGNEAFRAEYDINLSKGLSHEEALNSAINTVAKTKFKSEYDKLLSENPNMTQDEAIMKLTGAKSLQELEKYRYTDKHLDMVKSGEGAAATRDAVMHNIKKWVQDDYGKNTGKYSAFHHTAASKINSMDTQQFTDFMAKSKDEKREYIMKNWGVNDANAALIIANDLEESMAAGARVTTHGKHNTETARGIAVLTKKEREQREQADKYSRFVKAASDLSSPGGLRQALETIKNTQGKADVSTLIKQYSGGVDVMEAILKSASDPTAPRDVKDSDVQKYSKAIHFAQNNYLDLGKEGSAFNGIYKKLTGSSPMARQEALEDMAALGTIGQNNLSRMSDEEKTKLVKDIRERNEKNWDEKTKSKKFSADQIGKDAYLDMQLGKTIDALRKDGKADTKYIDALNDILHKGTYTSVSEVLNAAKDVTRSDKNLEGFHSWVENDVLSRARVGDIDGTDPIIKLSQVLESLVKGFNQWLQSQGINKV